MDFSQSYFALFELPQQFDVDPKALQQRYLQLQHELHPDRFSHTSASEQRLAVQYSSFVNQAYSTLRQPLARALYLLDLMGMSGEDVAACKLDGGFLIQQMELREKLESLHDLVDPETVIEHLIEEITGDLDAELKQVRDHLAAGERDAAAAAVVRMQYLDKLRAEAEEREAELMDA